MSRWRLTKSEHDENRRLARKMDVRTFEGVRCPECNGTTYFTQAEVCKRCNYIDRGQTWKKRDDSLSLEARIEKHKGTVMCRPWR